MKLDIDHENNVAYLALREIGAGEAKEQLPVYFGGAPEEIILDFDEQGALLGIEFLNARQQLGPLWNEDDAPDPPPPTPIPPDYWETAQ